MWQNLRYCITCMYCRITQYWKLLYWQLFIVSSTSWIHLDVFIYIIPIHKCITVSTVPRDWAFGRLYNYNLTILYTPRTLCIILTTIPLQFCQQFELKKQLEQLKCVPEIRYWLLEVLCNWILKSSSNFHFFHKMAARLGAIFEKIHQNIC